MVLPPTRTKQDPQSWDVNHAGSSAASKRGAQAETGCLAAAVVSAGSTCPVILSLLEAHTALVIFTLHRQRANGMTW